MYQIDPKRVFQALKKDDFPESYATAILKQFSETSDEIGQAIEYWLTTGQVPDFSIDGISVADVMKYRRSHVFLAIHSLWLLKVKENDPAEYGFWKKILTTQVYIE